MERGSCTAQPFRGDLSALANLWFPERRRRERAESCGAEEQARTPSLPVSYRPRVLRIEFPMALTVLVLALFGFVERVLMPRGLRR